MECPRCQQENPAAQKFCGECGAPLHGAGGSTGSIADLLAEIDGLRRALSEASEQQAATAEILRVISQSPTDVQPVLETIVQSAVRLCAGFYSLMFLYDGER